MFLNSARVDGFDTSDFVTSYLPVILFPMLYVGSRIYYKIKGIDASPIAPSAMDFYTSARDDSRDFDEEKPVGFKAKFKAVRFRSLSSCGLRLTNLVHSGSNGFAVRTTV